MTTEPQAARRGSFLFRTVPWLLAAGCFYIAYSKIAGTAAREGLTAFSYLIRFFAGANWLAWLGVMVPYSLFFFLVDSFATCKVINWFNTRVRYVDILPVRASTYILALLNEQVGKGAMAVYLYRRNRVPVTTSLKRETQPVKSVYPFLDCVPTRTWVPHRAS